MGFFPPVLLSNTSYVAQELNPTDFTEFQILWFSLLTADY